MLTHSPNSVIDQSYEALDCIARQPTRGGRALHDAPTAVNALIEPPLCMAPPSDLRWVLPDAMAVADREVWLVHPWNLGEIPAALPADTVVVGIFLSDFHHLWPWSERRWRFVASRMTELTTLQWHGDASALAAALKGARRVRSINEPHLTPWLARLASCETAPTLFPAVDKSCGSFSQWWTRASRGIPLASDLILARQAPAC